LEIFKKCFNKGGIIIFRLSPINLIEEENFSNAWARAVRFCHMFGTPLIFGDTKEPKKAKQSVQLISLTGNAITQIENGEIHPKYPFKNIRQYADEFTREFLEEYLKRSEDRKFVYLYFERMVKYEGSDGNLIDQLDLARQQLREQIDSGVASNRSQIVLWQRKKDDKSKAPPCVQRIWIQYLGDGQVDVHQEFRSRDLMALQANIIAIAECLNREVVWPNNCRIARIVDYSDSLHIYDSMQNVVDEVKLVPYTTLPAYH
jgi:thymidylate synthase